jgi:hypothetical protein
MRTPWRRGYKAAFLCSGMFNAGLTEAQVAPDEFARTYTEYRGQLATLPAVVDRRVRTVSVPFAPDMPPRIAAGGRAGLHQPAHRRRHGGGADPTAAERDAAPEHGRPALAGRRRGRGGARA